MNELASKIRPGWEEDERGLLGFLYRAKQFAEWPAEEVRAYAKKRNGAGKQLSWEYVWRMLSVREPETRSGLVRRWTKQEFSLRAWDREIQMVHGIRFRGRPPVRPETAEEAIRQTEEMARRWMMWCANSLGSRESARPDREERASLLAQFPVGLKRLLKQAMPIIEQIQKRARLAQLRSARVEAPGISVSKARRSVR